ncbi:hypothetical protein GGF49_003434 [Coemansia sp. RSA 1853]|nr:hypothetical protein GGF49_003434 [Coemansia sp. RSA 1853]
MAFPVGCALSAKLLKRVIRHERPAQTIHERSFGMPSTHSASIMYFAALVSYVVQDTDIAHVYALLGTCVLGFVGMLAAASRAINGHHTPAQVAAGCTLGVAFASMWWHYRSEMLPLIEQCI